MQENLLASATGTGMVAVGPMRSAAFTTALMLGKLVLALPATSVAAIDPGATPALPAAMPATGHAVMIGDLQDGLLLGPYLRIFEDKEGKATWDDVLAGKHEADFKTQNKAVPNFGSTRSVIWAVVDLEFSPGTSIPLSKRETEDARGDRRLVRTVSGVEPRAQEFLLELSHPVLDYVDVVVQDLSTKKILNRWETGDLRPFDSRPVRHRNFLFPIETGAARIWLKLSGESTVQIPLKIWIRPSFFESDNKDVALLGLYYGIISSMLIYNLILAGYMKSLSGYLYVAYMLVAATAQTTLDGLFYKFLPSMQFLNQRGITFFGGVLLVIAMLFTKQYLRLEARHRRLNCALLVFGIIGLIGALVSVTFGHRYALGFNLVYGVLGPITITIAAIHRIREKFRPAIYFLTAFCFIIAGTIVLALSRIIGFGGENFLVYHSMQIGSALEAILLSFGLADRIRLIQKEKELAQAATIEQQRILNDAFARFVPAPFLQILGKKSIPEVLLGDYTEREMTILFADIRGFTTISEKLSPKQTFNFINEYLHNTGPVIRKNGGFIDKYMGDGIMALFERREDAIKAALRLQNRNARLNKSLEGRMVSAINVGIGIHTGHLMLGTIGEPQRMDGTVISDAVNLASRVESLTKQYGVNLLVTKETLAGIPLGTAEFPWIRRFIDRIAVKGKSEPATIYEVVAVKNGKTTKYSKNWLLAWNEAMRLYYSREFAAAIKVIDRLLRKTPDDKTAQLFRSRCESYGVNPPREDWQGVAVAQNK